jgi:hypothetical protein
VARIHARRTVFLSTTSCCWIGNNSNVAQDAPCPNESSRESCDMPRSKTTRDLNQGEQFNRSGRLTRENHPQQYPGPSRESDHRRMGVSPEIAKHAR